MTLTNRCGRSPDRATAGLKLALFAALCCLCGRAGAAPLPAPLVALDFEEGGKNAGTLGGEADLVGYAPGQGPKATQGLDGLGVRLEGAPRVGGPGDDKVGGAVVIAAPALDALTRLTLAGWFRSPRPGSLTRLFFKGDSWDVTVADGHLGLAVVTGNEKKYHVVERGGAPWGEDWQFVAIVLDGEAGTAHGYRGQALTGRLAQTGEITGLGRPDGVESPVEIANLGGIRPFQGEIDRVRIYGEILDEAQVRQLFREGLTARPTLADAVGALPPRRGQGPKLSDVCFSTRWQKEQALPAIKAFGTTRCEWVYGEKPEYVRAVKDLGASYAATLNSNPKLPNNEGVARDFDGKPIIASWMVSWNALWVTSTHPNTKKALTDWAKRCVDAGADSIQTDDGALEAATALWGGDFEATTLQGFGAYLREHVPAATLAEWGIADTEGFDYREYLKKRYGFADAAAYKARLRELPTTPVWSAYLRHSARRHYTEMRRLLDTYGGRRTPLSMNVFDPRPALETLFLTDFCDYVLAETPTKDFGRDALRCATVRALGIGYVASPFPRSVAQTRAKTAGSYALGALPLVPYDIYMGSDATGTKPRYFGTPEEYGDLYAFVREHPQLFDGREAAPVVGILAPVEAYRDPETHAVARKLAEAHVPFTFALTGGEELKFALDPARLRRLRALVRVNPEEDFTPADREILAGLPVPVLTPEELTHEKVASLSPVTLHGPAGIYAVPRVAANGERRSLVIHLVNTNVAPDADRIAPQRMLSVMLRPLARLGLEMARATWYQPGAEPAPLEWDQTDEGPRLLVPRLAEWGIIEVEFAPTPS